MAADICHIYELILSVKRHLNSTCGDILLPMLNDLTPEREGVLLVPQNPEEDMR